MNRKTLILKSSRPRKEKWFMLLSVPFPFIKWNNFSRALIALWMTKQYWEIKLDQNFKFRFTISLDYARKIFTVSSLSADPVAIGRVGMRTNRFWVGWILFPFILQCVSDRPCVDISKWPHFKLWPVGVTWLAIAEAWELLVITLKCSVFLSCNLRFAT